MLRAQLFTLVKTGLGLCLVVLFVACATTGPAVAASPEWTRGGAHAGFGSATHITAVGMGNSRHAAEMDALGRLTLQFGMGIRVDERLRESYWEAMRDGAAATWGQDIALDRDVVVAGGIDNLIGAEIGDFWESPDGSSYALAVMNRARTVQIYSEMVRANQEIIANLTSMSVAERNTLDGFSRYQFAAMIADMNISYGAVLSFAGAPQYAQGLRRGDEFRRSAQEVAAAIPIGINITNDRDGRIQGAFSRAFSDLGFRTGGTNQRYMLNVSITAEPEDRPPLVRGDTVIVFARMALTANLVDTSTGAVLLPFSFTQREGHNTPALAENQTFIRAQQRIDREYSGLLSDYLSRLLPR